jgi:mycoredoxin
MTSNNEVTIYGTEWCAATGMARRYIEGQGVTYLFRDMDTDAEAEEQVRFWSGGDASHPTILVGDDILIEPNPAEIESALVKHGLIPNKKHTLP